MTKLQQTILERQEQNGLSKDDISFYFVSKDDNIAIISDLDSELFIVICEDCDSSYSDTFNDIQNDDDLIELIKEALNYYNYKNIYIGKIIDEYIEYAKNRGF